MVLFLAVKFIDHTVVGVRHDCAPLRYDQPPFERLGKFAGYLPKLVGLKSGLPKGGIGLPLEKPVSIPYTTRHATASGKVLYHLTATLSNSGEPLKLSVLKQCGNAFLAWSREPRYSNKPADVTMGKRRANP
jgi:hypothetical protein